MLNLFPGFYDTQYENRAHPDCRGRILSDDEGKFGYRAIVPPPYPVPSDVSYLKQLLSRPKLNALAKGPVGELLLSMGRHNMRPSHLHFMVQAPKYHKLVTAFYPEGCEFIQSDPVFGVKKSLVVVSIHYFVCEIPSNIFPSRSN